MLYDTEAGVYYQIVSNRYRQIHFGNTNLTAMRACEDD